MIEGELKSVFSHACRLQGYGRAGKAFQAGLRREWRQKDGENMHSR